MTKFHILMTRIGAAIWSIVSLVSILFILLYPVKLVAKDKPLDKNTKVFDSKELELKNRQYDCSICFTFRIDNLVSRQDVYLNFTLISKRFEYIEVNGNMLAGSKGDPKFEVEPSRFKKVKSDNYYCMSVWYPIEDPDELFNCSKIRLQTRTGNIDMELSRSEMKELRSYYEKASETVTTIFRTKTDITYGF